MTPHPSPPFALTLVDLRVDGGRGSTGAGAGGGPEEAVAAGLVEEGRGDLNLRLFRLGQSPDGCPAQGHLTGYRCQALIRPSCREHKRVTEYLNPVSASSSRGMPDGGSK